MAHDSACNHEVPRKGRTSEADGALQTPSAPAEDRPVAPPRATRCRIIPRLDVAANGGLPPEGPARAAVPLGKELPLTQALRMQGQVALPTVAPMLSVVHSNERWAEGGTVRDAAPSELETTSGGDAGFSERECLGVPFGLTASLASVTSSLGLTPDTSLNYDNLQQVSPHGRAARELA